MNLFVHNYILGKINWNTFITNSNLVAQLSCKTLRHQTHWLKCPRIMSVSSSEEQTQHVTSDDGAVIYKIP